MMPIMPLPEQNDKYSNGQIYGIPYLDQTECQPVAVFAALRCNLDNDEGGEDFEVAPKRQAHLVSKRGGRVRSTSSRPDRIFPLKGA